MKTENLVIFCSMAVGVGLCLLDALVDWQIHRADATFWETLAGRPSIYDLLVRASILATLVVCGIAVSSVLSRHRRAEMALRRERDLVAHIMDTSPVGIGVLDRDGNLTFVNRHLESLLGLAPGQIRRRMYNCGEWRITEYDGSEIPKEKLAFHRVMESRKPVYGIRYAIQWPDGRQAFLSISGAPLFDESGDVERVVTVVEDVSEAVRMEQSLRRSEERFRNIVLSSPMGIHTYALEDDGKLILTGANPAADVILGVRNARHIGKTIEEAFPSLVGNEVPDRYHRACADGEPWETDFIEYEDDRIKGAFQVHAFQTSPGTMAVMFLDITERKRAEEAFRHSEQRYRSIFEQSPEMVVLLSSQGLLLEANRKAEELTGFSQEELLGLHFTQLPVWPDGPPDGLAELFARRLSGDVVAPYELDCVRRDGSVLSYRVFGKALKDSEGGVSQVLLMMSDVTEQRLAERILRESEARLKSIFRAAPTGIGVAFDRVVKEVNDRLCGMLGYLHDELVGQNTRIFYPTDEDYEYAGRELYGQVRERGTAQVETRWHHKDGTVLDVLLRLASIDTADLSGWVTFTVLDITDRKRAEAALALSAHVNERLRTLAVAMNECRTLEEMLSPLLETALDVCRMDGGGVYLVEGEEAVLRLHTNVPDEFVHRVERMRLAPSGLRSIVDAVGPQDVSATSEEIMTIARSCGIQHAYSLALRAGDHVFGFMNLASMRDEPPGEADVRILGIIGLQAESVFNRLRAEDELRASEAKYRGITERSFDVIFMTDGQGMITYASPSAENVFRAKARNIIGRHFSQFLADTELPAMLPLFDATLEGNDVGVVQTEAVRPDGTHFFIEVNCSPIMDGGKVVGVQGIIRDVSERRVVEEKLHQMRAHLAHVARLSTMGEMAAGIAHEVNQPLYAILNFAKAACNVLANHPQPELSELHEWNSEIAAAASRAGEIVKGLRGFIQKTVPQRGRCRIEDVVHESVELIAFEARRRRVTVELDLAEETRPTNMDRVQIQQVLVNLLVNAYESLESVSSGPRRVMIRTASEGNGVLVSVVDNGPGLPGNGQTRMFSPFVSTKPEGLGMGLAIAKTIVESHGGRLWAGPNRAGGAAFHFTLPEHGRADNGER